jgi:hypothetical protein
MSHQEPALSATASFFLLPFLWYTEGSETVHRLFLLVRGSDELCFRRRAFRFGVELLAQNARRVRGGYANDE